VHVVLLPIEDVIRHFRDGHRDAGGRQGRQRLRMSFFGRRVALGSRLATGARMTVVTLAEIFALARRIAILVRIPTGASRFWCRVSDSRLVMASAGRGFDVGERGLEI
jgi:hypothetical protein